MAKKSRRARRQSGEKQRKMGIESTSKPQTTVAEPVFTPKATAPEIDLSQVVEAEPTIQPKQMNFIQEYFYVYQEVRNVLIVAVLMLVVLVGLSFVI